MAFSYNSVVAWLDKAVDAIIDNRKQVVIGIAAIVALALAGVGYHFYNQRAQARGHKAFIDALRYYDAPVATGRPTVISDVNVEFGAEAEKWNKVEQVFKDGYDKNKNAGIASMFLVYQADALTRLNKIDQAIAILADAVKMMPNDPLKDFYRLKLSLVKMDSSKEPVKQEGFAELKKLAEGSSSYAHEAALYYIGYYFWTQKDYTQAQNYWQQLMVKYGLKDAKEQSGFAELVRGKLKLISSEW